MHPSRRAFATRAPLVACSTRSAINTPCARLVPHAVFTPLLNCAGHQPVLHRGHLPAVLSALPGWNRHVGQVEGHLGEKISKDVVSRRRRL
eukprot:628047-Prymnesium_polylepis.1